MSSKLYFMNAINGLRNYSRNALEFLKLERRRMIGEIDEEQEIKMYKEFRDRSSQSGSEEYQTKSHLEKNLMGNRQ